MVTFNLGTLSLYLGKKKLTWREMDSLFKQTWTKLETSKLQQTHLALSRLVWDKYERSRKVVRNALHTTSIIVPS